MEKQKTDNSALRNLLEKSKAPLVLLGDEDLDLIAAGLGLVGFLEAWGKNTNLVLGRGDLPPRAKNLPGWKKIGRELSGDFVITLTSAVGNVEKVSYYVEGDDLHLVVKPYPHAPPFSQEQVKFKSGGTDYDLLFVLGVEKLEDLGRLYRENKNLFSQTPIVNISLRENARFGKLNFIFPSSSFSEIIVHLVQDLGGKLSPEAATNLLAGIFWATDNLRASQAGVSAFEAAAFCLKQGGRKIFFKKDEGKKGPEMKEKPVLMKQDWLRPKIYQGGELI